LLLNWIKVHEIDKLESLMTTVLHSLEVINVTLNIISIMVVHVVDIAVEVLLVVEVSVLNIFGVHVKLVSGFECRSG